MAAHQFSSANEYRLSTGSGGINSGFFSMETPAPEQTQNAPFHVVIAGAGVAGLTAALSFVYLFGKEGVNIPIIPPEYDIHTGRAEASAREDTPVLGPFDRPIVVSIIERMESKHSLLKNRGGSHQIAFGALTALSFLGNAAAIFRAGADRFDIAEFINSSGQLEKRIKCRYDKNHDFVVAPRSHLLLSLFCALELANDEETEYDTKPLHFQKTQNKKREKPEQSERNFRTSYVRWEYIVSGHVTVRILFAHAVEKVSLNERVEMDAISGKTECLITPVNQKDASSPNNSSENISFCQSATSSSPFILPCHLVLGCDGIRSVVLSSIIDNEKKDTKKAAPEFDNTIKFRNIYAYWGCAPLEDKELHCRYAFAARSRGFYIGGGTINSWSASHVRSARLRKIIRNVKRGGSSGESSSSTEHVGGYSTEKRLSTSLEDMADLSDLSINNFVLESGRSKSTHGEPHELDNRSLTHSGEHLESGRKISTHISEPSRHSTAECKSVNVAHSSTDRGYDSVPVNHLSDGNMYDRKNSNEFLEYHHTATGSAYNSRRGSETSNPHLPDSSEVSRQTSVIRSHLYWAAFVKCDKSEQDAIEKENPVDQVLKLLNATKEIPPDEKQEDNSEKKPSKVHDWKDLPQIKPIVRSLHSPVEVSCVRVKVEDRKRQLPKYTCKELNAVLLGDAAHPSTPFQGQGANMAICDAFIFVRLLRARGASVSALPDVFKRFDSIRVKECNTVVERSRNIGKWLLSDSVLISKIYSVAMKTVPSWVMIESVTSIDKHNSDDIFSLIKHHPIRSHGELHLYHQDIGEFYNSNNIAADTGNDADPDPH